MTPEQEARKLLTELAETQEWAKDHDCTGIAHSTQYPTSCPHCHGSGVIPLADLEVAAWRAVEWLGKHGAALRKAPVLISPWWVDATVSTDWCDDPIIAVFKAVLALSKEQADA